MAGGGAIAGRLGALALRARRGGPRGGGGGGTFQKEKRQAEREGGAALPRQSKKKKKKKKRKGEGGRLPPPPPRRSATPDGDRNRDLQLRKQTLYPLSHGGDSDPGGAARETPHSAPRSSAGRGGELCI